MALSQRLAGLPGWSWPLISAALVTAAVLTPWPGPPSNPAAGLFREPLLVTRTESGDKIVPFGRHEGIGPVWAVSLQTTDRATVHRRFGSSQDSKTPGLGFFHRRDQWSYELAANRFDAKSRQTPPESLWMSQENAKELRPLVVAELERRSGPAHHGVLLETLLDDGAQRESWASWQNGLVLLAWLSIPVALWAVVRPARPRKSERLARLMSEHFA